MKTFALFHPGEMGAALGAALASRGFRVLWASQGRSTQTATRAKGVGLEDACTIEQAVKAAEVVISVCPPHAALALARDPDRLRGLKEKLAQNLPTAPLFDAERFRQGIEAAYVRMVSR